MREKMLNKTLSIKADEIDEIREKVNSEEKIFLTLKNESVNYDKTPKHLEEILL